MESIHLNGIVMKPIIYMVHQSSYELDDVVNKNKDSDILDITE